MHPDALRLLEFDTVRHILAEFTSTRPGRELALGIEPSDDVERIERALTQTDEMLQASEREFRTPVGGVDDVRAQARRAAAGGGPLEPQVLWQIAVLCERAGALARALHLLADRYPTLGELGARIPHLADLDAHIRACVDASGRVLDAATPRLAELRSRVVSLRRQIEERLDALIHNPAIGPNLQYPNPSFCHERYVLPVNAKRRMHVRGIVHGTSDSGATVFVEPMQIVETGNRLAEAVGAEEEEVQAVLWERTREVGHDVEEILTAQQVLAEMDLLMARVRMARRYRMVRPVMSRGRVLELQEARHPILLWLTEQPVAEGQQRREPDFDAVVPLDLHLGDEFRVLVVTGPNTGGKTVTLKTIGLICLMARAGLHVPAEHAIIPMYDSVYVDIGDEQSLEQSLSTFGSHMSRIIRVLRSAAAESLVLLDELGAGTDPTEGAALALAVLEELVRRQCPAVVTTHLGRLKTFAGTCAQAENACMDFDLQTLRPTYRMTIGTAGSSNALEIAQRLGMAPSLLADARAVLDRQSGGEYGAMLEEVAVAKRDAEARRLRAQYLETAAEKLKAEYDEKLSRIRNEEERTGADAGMRVHDDLQGLLEAASKLCEEMRFTQKPHARKVREIRDGLRVALERTEKLLAGHRIKRPLRPGDEVYVVKVHRWGTVERVDQDRGRAQVNVGGMKMEIDLEDLVPWGTDMGTIQGR